MKHLPLMANVSAGSIVRSKSQSRTRAKSCSEQEAALGEGAPTSQVLAVFDFDGTLIRGDSFLPFVIGYARFRRRFWPLIMVPFWVGLYAVKLISDHRAKQRILVSFFRGEPRVAVAEYARGFCERWVVPRLFESVFNRLAWHQSAGHRVVLLSASPDLYVDVVAEALGIGEVLCTRVLTTSGSCDGSLDGPNCKGEQKLVRLRSHLGTDKWSGETFAYGDSKSDLPVLQWATNGFLVGRTGKMRRI